MNLIAAVTLLEKRKDELEALTEWAKRLDSSKPIHGKHWDKITRTIDEVLTDFEEETEQLEREIISAAQNIEIQWNEK